VTPDGPYTVEWTSGAKRTLISLSEKVAPAAIEFIYSALAERPHVVGRPLRFELEGLWSARRGDYRVIFVIDDARHSVVVVAIGHRADVYRRRQPGG